MRKLQNAIKARNKGTLYTHIYLISEKQSDEQGRSMVEMLAVLAVIGVLSIGGVVGFRSAMDKNIANTIINEAQKRATLVVSQIQMMESAEPTLAEFNPYNTITGGTFSGTVYTKNNSSIAAGQFAIKVSGVQKAVCQKILNGIGDNTIIRRLSTESAPTTALTTCVDDNTLLFVYNNDMSIKPLPTDFDNKTSCTDAGFVWNNGQCANDLCDTCPSSQTCLTISGEKKCVSECPSGKERDENTGKCEDDKCTDYTNCEEGYFCNFDSACATTGTCKAISAISTRTGTLTVSGVEYTAICSSAGLNNLGSFYKAEDWCLAQGGRLPTSSETCVRTETSFGPCQTNSTATSLRGQIRSLCNAGIGSDWMWATYAGNDRDLCKMFSFRLDASGDSRGTYESGAKSDRRTLCLLPK